MVWIIERQIAGEWTRLPSTYRTEVQAIAYMNGMKHQDPHGVYRARKIVV